MPESRALPLVSVVIPVSNEIHYLPRCLDSVLAQDACDIEICISDNNSTDGTSLYLQELALKDNRISRIIHSAPITKEANFKSAVNLAKGRFVYPMGADDYLTAGSLGIMAATLASDNNLAAVVGRMQYFSDKSGLILAELPPTAFEEVCQDKDPSQLIRWLINNYNHDEILLALWRRELLAWAVSVVRHPTLEPPGFWWVMAAMGAAVGQNQRMTTSNQMVLRKRYEHQVASGGRTITQSDQDQIPRSRRTRLSTFLSKWRNSFRNAIAIGSTVPLHMRLFFVVGNRRHSEGTSAFNLLFPMKQSFAFARRND